ncbi:CU044_5270 family protein [Spirillospora sp. CA-128828]|uniref:CU044_5270 family protein n=1 Tax=Spirillospora sp. CA-128828 TaxID=3240033 RepID=UPI003D8E1023
MTTGEKMKDADTIFRELKPAALDELAGDAHARRRDGDLARAMHAAAAPRRRARRPVLLVAGVAAAACAAAGTVVLANGGEPASRPPAAGREAVDARTFLLASATAAAKAPAATGRYWYDRQRTSSEVGGHRTVVVGKGPDARKVKKKISYRASIETPGEGWLARDGGKGRKTSGPEKLVFPTAGDEARWREDGSPRLVSGSNEKRIWEGPSQPSIGSDVVSFKELASLPTDAGRLQAVLRDRYARDLKASENPFTGTFTAYLWETARDLLAGPITPGTKSALFKVLAGQPGIRMIGRTTDRLGRPGMAVAVKEAPDGGANATESRLVISAKTADLLEFRMWESGYGTGVTTYEKMGWVGALGARL